MTSSYAGATDGGGWFIFTQFIFIELFVLFFPLRRLEASGIGSFFNGKASRTLNLL